MPTKPLSKEQEEKIAQDEAEEKADEEFWEEENRKWFAEHPELKEAEESEPIDPEAEYKAQKKRILNKLEAQIDAENSKSEFFKWLEENEIFQPYMKSIVTCLSSFTKPEYEQIGKIEFVMVRNGDTVDTFVKCYNKGGSETMFDKDGNVVTVIKSDEESE